MGADTNVVVVCVVKYSQMRISQTYMIEVTPGSLQ